jgi:hypothetical protein
MGGAIVIFVSWKELKINADFAKLGLRGIILMLVLLTFFIVFSIIAGIFSWMDYRHEEIDLLKETNSRFRKPPTWCNFWRWNEFYIVIFLNLATTIIILFLEQWVIPLIK